MARRASGGSTRRRAPRRGPVGDEGFRLARVGVLVGDRTAYSLETKSVQGRVAGASASGTSRAAVTSGRSPCQATSMAPLPLRPLPGKGHGRAPQGLPGRDYFFVGYGDGKIPRPVRCPLVGMGPPGVLSRRHNSGHEGSEHRRPALGRAADPAATPVGGVGQRCGGRAGLGGGPQAGGPFPEGEIGAGGRGRVAGRPARRRPGGRAIKVAEQASRDLERRGRRPNSPCAWPWRKTRPWKFVNAAELLLGKLGKRRGPNGRSTRGVRLAVAVLGQSGTPEARRALEELCGGRQMRW